MYCKDLEVSVGCLTRPDGTRTSVSIHYEYRTAASGEAVLYATRYTNAAGIPIVLAAGEIVTAGACQATCDDPLIVKQAGDLYEDFYIPGDELTTPAPQLPPNAPGNGWEYSVNSGATWQPYTVPVLYPTGPRGTLRFRNMTFVYPCNGSVFMDRKGNSVYDAYGTGNERGIFYLNGGFSYETSYVTLPGTTLNPGGGGNMTPFIAGIGAGVEYHAGSANGSKPGYMASPVFTYSNAMCNAEPGTPCKALYKITDCDGEVRWETPDGQEHESFGQELRGLCVPVDVETIITKELGCVNGISYVVTTVTKYTSKGDFISEKKTWLSDENIEYAQQPVDFSYGACTSAANECKSVSSQQVTLCDLNPNNPPDTEGRVCATKFLRTYFYNCVGELTDYRDTDVFGAPFTPVAVVDCNGGTPSLVELPWVRSAVRVKAGGDPLKNFEFVMTNPQDGTTAIVEFNTVTAVGGCGPFVPNSPVPVSAQGGVSPNSRFTFNLSPQAQMASTFYLVFQDLDPFEGVRGLTPSPSRVEFTIGSGVWDGAGNIDAAVSNSECVVYWDNPPASITHLYRNNGGGTSCHSADVGMATFVAGPCCTECSGSEPFELPDYITQIGQSALGCANGVPYQRLLRGAFDMVSGLNVGGEVAYMDSAGNTSTVMPVGFRLGACPDVMTREVCAKNALGCDTTFYQHYTQVGVGPEIILGYTAAEPFVPANYITPVGPISYAPCKCLVLDCDFLQDGVIFGTPPTLDTLGGQVSGQPQVVLNGSGIVIRKFYSGNACKPVEVKFKITKVSGAGNAQVVFYANGDINYFNQAVWDTEIIMPCNGMPISLGVSGFRSTAGEYFIIQPTDTPATQYLPSPGAAVTPVFAAPWQGTFQDGNTNVYSYFGFGALRKYKFRTISSAGVSEQITLGLEKVPGIKSVDCGCSLCDDPFVYDDSVPVVQTIEKPSTQSVQTALSANYVAPAGALQIIVRNLATGATTAANTAFVMGTPIYPGERIQLTANPGYRLPSALITGKPTAILNVVEIR